ncbi:GNAT family N-acetyltransferase [Dyella japonica]|uniref:GNAT family N-acetyltransferase n=1 Tax=Dyella japonica TaxID=231455 RepID=UPI0004750E55|nr:GNAT family N-acetyltransferase [Dyella japonica]
MKSRLHMRLAHAEDARAIGVLVRRVTRRWIVPTQPAAAVGPMLATMTARAIRARIGAGQRFHLAFVDDVLVGVAAIRDDRHVFQLFVGTRYQGQGIARKLWDRLRNDAVRRAGTRVFTLNAAEGAVPIYLRFGFVYDGDPGRRRGHVIAVPMIYCIDDPSVAQRRPRRISASRIGARVAGESISTASRPRQVAAR